MAAEDVNVEVTSGTATAKEKKEEDKKEEESHFVAVD